MTSPLKAIFATLIFPSNFTLKFPRRSLNNKQNEERINDFECPRTTRRRSENEKKKKKTEKRKKEEEGKEKEDVMEEESLNRQIVNGQRDQNNRRATSVDPR